MTQVAKDVDNEEAMLVLASLGDPRQQLLIKYAHHLRKEYPWFKDDSLEFILEFINRYNLGRLAESRIRSGMNS